MSKRGPQKLSLLSQVMSGPIRTIPGWFISRALIGMPICTDHPNTFANPSAKVHVMAVTSTSQMSKLPMTSTPILTKMDEPNPGSFVNVNGVR